MLTLEIEFNGKRDGLCFSDLALIEAAKTEENRSALLDCIGGYIDLWLKEVKKTDV